MNKSYSCLVVFLVLLQNIVYGQQNKSAWYQFKKLSKPEKCWVISHPFVARKALHFTQIARKQTDSIQHNPMLDGDANGGGVDAFRHAYWMALLTQNIGWRKAYRLGKAHEKGNYLDYKKHRMEDGSLPDKAAGDMDIWNNNAGINISRNYCGISADSLKSIVIANILQGKMKVIRKNSMGEFLDIRFQLIPTDSLMGKWDNLKVLDNSNYRIEK